MNSTVSINQQSRMTMLTFLQVDSFFVHSGWQVHSTIIYSEVEHGHVGLGEQVTTNAERFYGDEGTTREVQGAVVDGTAPDVYVKFCEDLWQGVARDGVIFYIKQLHNLKQSARMQSRL